MARRRFRDPDPAVRDRNKWDATGQPAVGGLSRIGGGSRGGPTTIVARGGGDGGQVRIEHVTLYAEASQTIASGGASVTWDRIGTAPTEIRGFATAADTIASTGSVVAIPIDVTGELEIVLDWLWESYRATGEATITRTRHGATATRTFDLGLIRSRAGDGVTLGWEVRAGDTISVALPNDSGTDQELAEATVELRVITLAAATSPEPTGSSEVRFHLIADNTADFYLDGEVIATGVGFGEQLVVATVAAGNRTITIEGTQASGTPGSNPAAVYLAVYEYDSDTGTEGALLFATDTSSAWGGLSYPGSDPAGWPNANPDEDWGPVYEQTAHDSHGFPETWIWTDPDSLDQPVGTCYFRGLWTKR